MSFALPGQTMDVQETTPQAQSQRKIWADRLEATGGQVIRYGLVLVLLWIGAMKFTTYEAEAISGFVSNSPLMARAYYVLSKEQLSALIGVVEVLIATLIASRPFSARLSAIGGALAAGMFLTTLTFLFTTPGVVESSLGFPALSVVPGQFLVKDVVLLGTALWCAGEALGVAGKETRSVPGCQCHS